MTVDNRNPKRPARLLLLAGGGFLLAVSALLAVPRIAPGAAPPTAPALITPMATGAPPSATPVPRTTVSTASPALPTVAPSATPVPPTAVPSATLAPPALSAAAPARPIRYAAIGASDTVGVGTSDPVHMNWTARIAEQLPPDTVYQRFARSGITLYEAMGVEVPDAVAFHPNLVTVWLVVNDALRGVPLPVYQKELVALLDELTTKTDATIVLLNAPDISNVLQPDASAQTRLQMRSVAQIWNQGIATAAAPYGNRVLIIDLFAPSEQAPHHAEWLSPDGFHPSAAGYQEIADTVVATMRRGGLIP
jgi:lysophospholipase L1-like esterase